MKNAGYHILRVGMGVTFFWIGVLIFRDPLGWGSLLQPWALHLLPLPLREMMIGTAAMDILIGFLFLIDVWVWPAALVASIHLVVVLTTTGINEITVRDIGLLTAAIALFADDLPDEARAWFRSLEKKN